MRRGKPQDTQSLICLGFFVYDVENQRIPFHPRTPLVEESETIGLGVLFRSYMTVPEKS